MNNSTSKDIYKYICNISLMWYELQIRRKALWLFDCRVLVGIHNVANILILYGSTDSWKKKKSSKAVGENKTGKYHEFENIISFFCKKKRKEKRTGFPEAWKVFFSGCASILLSGEGLMQILASHTHLAAGNHIHFAIFFL